MNVPFFSVATRHYPKLWCHSLTDIHNDGWIKWPTFCKRNFHVHFNERKVCYSIKDSLKYLPNDDKENKSLLVQVMGWRREWSKELPEPMTLNDVHYNDVIMGTMASEITSLTIVYSTVYSGADQRKHQNCASLAFVWGIHRGPGTPRGPVNSPHKWSVTRDMFPFDDVIMCQTMHPQAQCFYTFHNTHCPHGSQQGYSRARVNVKAHKHP